MRLEETVETLAKQHIQLERACEIEKVKESYKSVAHLENTENPIIIPLGVSSREDGSEEEDDHFEDAISDLPESYSAYTSTNSEIVNFMTENFEEDSYSANDNTSVDLSLQQSKHFMDLEIKRAHSDQAISDAKPSGHKRWLSEDVTAGTFGMVRFKYQLFI